MTGARQLHPAGRELALMPWFPVDDSFHSHPKVMATSPAALGLWVVAGSWSSKHHTDGVLRDDVLPRLLPDAVPLADELVAKGLWKKVRGGYAFHDWFDWGSKLTGTQAKELSAKRAEAGRKGGVASGRARGKPGSKPEASCFDDASPGLEPQSQSHLVVDTSDHPPVSNGRALGDDVIETIIREIYAQTTRVIDADWAAKIAGHILGDRSIRDAAGYCRKTIRSEADPRRRFLPNPT